jgi:hypothetical protein
MLGFVLETDLGIVPVFELILKTDQKRFGLIRRVFPKDEKNNLMTMFPLNLLRVNYARVGDAIALIQHLGPGCFLAKTDIKSAFRIIPIMIHPELL